MNDIKLLRDHIIKLQTKITELGKKPNTVIRFVSNDTIPQQLLINVVYYNLSDDTVTVYNDYTNEWKTFSFNSSTSSWDDITDKPTEFPPTTHTHNDIEINLTETYTGNLTGATTQKQANDILDSLVGGVLETNLVASNEIKFDTLNQYGSIVSPRTGDITVNFTDAKLGVVQVMFHDALTMPAEILSNTKFIILQGYYTPDSVNRLSFELVDKTAGNEKILVSIIPCE